MKNMNISAILLLTLFLLSAVSVSRTEAKTFDNRLYADLLQTYVKDGVVNYKDMKSEEAKLDAYLQLLDAANPDELARNEQFAFYINVYNAYTLKMILENYPIESIKDAGSFLKSPWKIDFVKVGGETLSLDDVEHKILRPRFKDARVHFAVNCASKDCPPLLSEPYQGDMLEEQLENATRSFLNNPQKNYLDGKTLYVTRIFKWFKGDFNDDPFGFVLKFAEGDFKKALEAEKKRIKVKYLDYDWSLNGE